MVLSQPNGQKTVWRVLMIIVAMVMLGIAVAPTTQANAQPTNSINVYAAFQNYENGFMIWRSDTNKIYVFYRNFTDGGTYAEFPETAYATLPDNPVTDPTPNGLVRPVRGFGRVWGNFSEVQANLGWATTPESGYNATLYTIPNTLFIALPNASFISLSFNNWSQTFSNPVPIPSPPPPPPPPVPTQPPPQQINSPSTYQYYQGGLMTWWSHDGTIMVFANSGQVLRYPVSQYGALAENTWVYPPSGFVRPIMGFGKVWANHAYVNRILGWATTFERSYTAQITLDDAIGNDIAFYVSAPNGQVITVTEAGTWYYA